MFTTPRKPARTVDQWGPTDKSKIIHDVHLGDHLYMKDERLPTKSSYNENVYDSLINLILNHKMELKKMPSLMTEDGARRYAANSGGNYRYQAKDLNNDGEKDIILYNKAGKPVIINGYKAASSDFGLINAYRQELPSESLRKSVGGLDGWKKSKFQYVEGEKYWDDNTIGNESPAEFEKLAERGYRRVAKPGIKKSFYAIFTKALSKELPDWWANFTGTNGFSVEIEKLCRPLSFYRLIYMMYVEIPLYAEVGKGKTYEAFKKHLSKNSAIIEAFRAEFIRKLKADTLNMTEILDDALLSKLGNSEYTIINMLIGDGTFPDSNGKPIKIDNDTYPPDWREDETLKPAQMRAKKAFFEYAREVVDERISKTAEFIKSLMGGNKQGYKMIKQQEEEEEAL